MSLSEPVAPSQPLVARLFEHHGAPVSAVRYTGIPRLPRSTTLTRLTSPLVAAYQGGAKVFSLWEHRAGGPFVVHLGGSHGFPRTVDGHGGAGVPVLFPPGARGGSVGSAVAALGDEISAISTELVAQARIRRGHAGE